jgi:ATP-binding cassette subfamily F protein 3
LRQINFYSCDYSGYVEERERLELIKLADYKRQSEWLESQEKLVNRFKAGSRAGWAKSREKMLERVEKIEAPYIPKKPKFFFEYV